MNQFDDKLDNNVFGSGHETMEHELLQSARTNFVKKVYSILGIQLLVTSGFVSLSTFNDAFRLYQQENLALFWVSFFVCLVSMIALFCVRGLATRSPINIILLSLFTLCESYSVSMICGFYEPVSVLNAAIATLAATIALTLYAIKTESDFSESYSKCYGFFWSFFAVTFCLSIMNIFFLKSSFISVLIGIGCGAIYSLYLIIDTQLILGGKNKELTLDNYILGAILLYVDIIGLFLEILKIIGKSRD